MRDKQLYPNSTALIYRYLDTKGDGTGTKNANGDYSTPDIFYIAPDLKDMVLHRLIVLIEDGANMRAEHYGTLGAALTNGVVVRVSDPSGVLVDLTDESPIKTNAGWGALCYDVDVKAWGAGNDLLLVRWTFAKAGIPLVLDAKAGHKLEVVLSDDLQGLVRHYFMVQGWELP